MLSPIALDMVGEIPVQTWSREWDPQFRVHYGSCSRSDVSVCLRRFSREKVDQKAILGRQALPLSLTPETRKAQKIQRLDTVVIRTGTGDEAAPQTPVVEPLLLTG